MVDDDLRARKVARKRGGFGHMPPRRLQVVGQSISLEECVTLLPARIAHRSRCADDSRHLRRRRRGARLLADAANEVEGRVSGQHIGNVVAREPGLADFAKSIGAVKYFDAGDVQANGFQIVEDDRSGETFTESGASYMGFAVSALLAAGIADKPHYAIAFSGDGSFTMNPQVLIDAVEHRAKGMIVIFDNRRMAAIGSLQRAQYGTEYKANDSVAVDYVRLAGSVSGVRTAFGGFDKTSLANALKEAYDPDRLSVLHVPVYSGEDPMAGLGAWGQWNVGNWCETVQSEWLKSGL